MLECRIAIVDIETTENLAREVLWKTVVPCWDVNTAEYRKSGGHPKPVSMTFDKSSRLTKRNSLVYPPIFLTLITSRLWRHHVHIRIAPHACSVDV
jgi:hypothetical protein